MMVPLERLSIYSILNFTGYEPVTGEYEVIALVIGWDRD